MSLAIALSQQDLLIGVVKGLTYAALAAGFVLIYRSTGVLNFAHAETGALGVAVFVLLLVRYDINWWLAYAIAIAVGAVTGMIIELLIVRRLFTSPRLVLLIATIGVAQLLQAVKINLPAVTSPGPIPLPFTKAFGDPRTDSLVLRPREYLVIIIVPLLILGLALFLGKTRFGLAVRATASNADGARIYGTSPKKTSTIVWTIAGALAVATAVLFAPFQISNAAQAGTAALAAPLLLRAVTVGLLARMRSLPLVLAAGVGVGVVEQVVLANVESTNRNVVDLYLLLAVLVVVLLAKRSARDSASWSLSPKLAPIPDHLKTVWWIKHLNLIGFVILFGVFAVLGLVLSSNSQLFVWSSIIVIAIVGLSLSLLTGWAGQLSLGQFAFVGLGAMSMATLTQGNEIPLIGRGFTLNWWLALAIVVVLGVLTAVVIGLPALRMKGLFLAVATLAFAVASSNWLLLQDVFTNGSTASQPVRAPSLGPIDFAESRRSYYWLCLISLAVLAAMVAQIRRTGVGRRIIAVRENEDAAAASTVPSATTKLTAFAISGGIAAFAGALFITLQSSIQPSVTFGPEQSIRIVAIVIIGGLGSVAGPILGALWVQGIPALWGATPPDVVVLLTSSIGLLLLLMYFPGGLQQIVYSARDVLIRIAEQRNPAPAPDPTAAQRVATIPARTRPVIDLPDGAPVLSVNDLSVTFGGLRAVDTVTAEARKGEMVGLIGTNGSGKSTLLNAISGFVPSVGRIEVLGQDVSDLSAHARHRLGLGRGFQAARLYADLTVRETLMVALEARERTRLGPALLYLPPSQRIERTKRAQADEIIDFLGLGRFSDRLISQLSTGTRRVVELGGLLAVDAQVLLLDEPTGGVAQRETEAFGPLIRRIQQELDATVVLIEHDMPLVMSICDRVYCLEAGAVIAQGSPDEVRNHPRVIASYLGTDERAIHRSDQSPVPAPVSLS
jgi:ABC-type branched-subunit amino acid transport system ATPase component/ABC-type branched-subunit amino acid transport system permease subunit